jgi:hypothetical protein
MILPAKHIPPERSLSGIGADILRALDTPRTVSETWTRMKMLRLESASPITFDWFVLAISWLYSISAVKLEDGMLSRKQPS